MVQGNKSGYVWFFDLFGACSGGLGSFYQEAVMKCRNGSDMAGMAEEENKNGNENTGNVSGAL